MRVLKFPGDSLLLGESRYRLKRIGRDEWLDARAIVTDDAEQAADFYSATEAVLWLTAHVEKPEVWHFEEFFTVGC